MFVKRFETTSTLTVCQTGSSLANRQTISIISFVQRHGRNLQTQTNFALSSSSVLSVSGINCKPNLSNPISYALLTAKPIICQACLFSTPCGSSIASVSVESSDICSHEVRGRFSASKRRDSTRPMVGGSPRHWTLEIHRRMTDHERSWISRISGVFSTRLEMMMMVAKRYFSFCANTDSCSRVLGMPSDGIIGYSFRVFFFFFNFYLAPEEVGKLTKK